MTRRHVAAVLLALLAGGCVRAPAPTPAQTGLRRVAVFPPLNRTGDELVVEGGTLLEKYAFHTARVTVPDVLAAEARRQFQAAGVTVVAPDTVDAAAGDHPPLSAEQAGRRAALAHIDAPVLFIDLGRWEPDAPFQPSFIIVSLEATLVDPKDGRVLWSAKRPSRPIATQGVIDLPAADVVAATAVMAEVMAPLFRPAPR